MPVGSSIWYIKVILDFFISTICAIVLGYVIATIELPQFNPRMMADFSAVEGACYVSDRISDLWDYVVSGGQYAASRTVDYSFFVFLERQYPLIKRFSNAREDLMQPMPHHVASFILQHHVISLAICTEQGPWAASCFYAVDIEKGYLLILTDPAIRHGVAMVNQDIVAGTISGQPMTWRKICGIQLIASVRISGSHESHESHDA